MDKSQVKGYGLRGDSARLDFLDDSCLILEPYRNWGNIEGFKSAQLYKSGTLEALAIDRPSRYAGPEESGFWSRSSVTQQELADYMNVARQLSMEAYDKQRSGGMSQKEWDDKYWEFWRITTQSGMLNRILSEGKGRIFTERPRLYREKL